MEIVKFKDDNKPMAIEVYKAKNTIVITMVYDDDYSEKYVMSLPIKEAEDFTNQIINLL